MNIAHTFHGRCVEIGIQSFQGTRAHAESKLDGAQVTGDVNPSQRDLVSWRPHPLVRLGVSFDANVPEEHFAVVRERHKHVAVLTLVVHHLASLTVNLHTLCKP